MAQNIFEKEKEFFLHTYNRIPIEIKSAQGVHLLDKDGNRYLDFFSGLGVNALGYAHPKIVKAVSEQIAKFVNDTYAKQDYNKTTAQCVRNK